MKAAEAADTKVIGVDVDQSQESDTVITSSMKNLSKSVYDALAAYYAGNFPGGISVTLDATVEGVQLPMENSRFETFTQADYDGIYGKIVGQQIEIMNDADVVEDSGKEADQVSAADIPVSKVQVEVIR